MQDISSTSISESLLLSCHEKRWDYIISLGKYSAVANARDAWRYANEDRFRISLSIFDIGSSRTPGVTLSSSSGYDGFETGGVAVTISLIANQSVVSRKVVIAGEALCSRGASSVDDGDMIVLACGWDGVQCMYARWMYFKHSIRGSRIRLASYLPVLLHALHASPIHSLGGPSSATAHVHRSLNTSKCPRNVPLPAAQDTASLLPISAHGQRYTRALTLSPFPPPPATLFPFALHVRIQY
ncbi:hypothetical protein Hypma_016568 [Hypsizygus marmoreus]|uniref:Uncharacterized protein n=1 Tax=Hypsizygus marmoreus TaxID=39966 RepID=A0A369J5A9_HYPMA|nr:hypothetical protein Hypma_016568 [Hypsizygus marmoreus]